MVGLLATVALIVGLLWQPEASLGVLWNMVIPLVPATLLISPLLWRNSCPLATLNLLSNRPGRVVTPGPRFVAVTTGLGIVLLMTLVPARSFLFDSNGTALALTIISVAAAALVLGAVFDLKAGFCNAFCPVLPVERLYGQNPLFDSGNARCATCTRCTRACIDVSPRKSIPQLFGRSRHSASWLRTPFGTFAAAFPGFVIAYFMSVDTTLSSAGIIYVGVLALAGASYAFVVVAVRALRLSSGSALPALGAIAAALYYWFAAPGLAEAFGLAEAAGTVLRLTSLALIAAWWWNAQRAARRHAAHVHRPPVAPLVHLGVHSEGGES